VSVVAVIGAVLVATAGTAFANDAPLLICKAADNSNGTVSGTFHFTVNSVRNFVPVTETFDIAPGSCNGASYDTGTATITETANPGTTLTGISVDPNNMLISSDLSTRTVTVSLLDFVTVTTTFTNQNTPPPPPSGCSLTWGFYKNHSGVVTGLVNAAGGLLVGADTLTAAQVNTLLSTNENGPNYLIKLEHQLIAAELNQLGGASTPAAVQTAINAANALIAASGGTATSATTVTYLGNTYTASGLNDTLDTYNNGKAAGGPAHCSG
jgi:hypothetical protein